MSVELPATRAEVVYLSYEENELKARIAFVRATYDGDKPDDFAQAFTELLSFLEE